MSPYFWSKASNWVWNSEGAAVLAVTAAGTATPGVLSSGSSAGSAPSGKPSRIVTRNTWSSPPLRAFATCIAEMKRVETRRWASVLSRGTKVWL